MYFEKEWESIDWIHLEGYMDQWLAVLYAIMKFQFLNKTEYHRLTATVLAV